jgi:hypothetical protein
VRETGPVWIESKGKRMGRVKLTTDVELEKLQYEIYEYFLHEANPANGLILDKTAPNWPSSIAATGLALASYPVFVERGFMSHAAAVERTLTTLRFFWNSRQGLEPDATGYKGFYYHFLDMKTGQRAWQCELSTIDSTFLFAGMLTASMYFDASTDDEREIRTLADALYRRADWQWAQNQGATVTQGWNPESGAILFRWEGYNEGMLLYILGLGSPTYPLPESSYTAWTSTYEWKNNYGYDYLYSGPLFTHQLSHVWIDFRKIQDAFMREKGIDYFENSRRATYVQQYYAISNPLDFVGYGPCCWGLTASDGPGPDTLKVNGIERQFYDYIARGAPYGPDDGTIAPWVAVTSLPFAPEIALPVLDHYIYKLNLKEGHRYGFRATFNASHPNKNHPYGWVSPWHFGINVGTMMLMIENYRTDFVWKLMRNCPYIVNGLRRAGFSGGWL